MDVAIGEGSRWSSVAIGDHRMEAIGLLRTDATA